MTPTTPLHPATPTNTAGRPLGVCIVGTGGIARFHARACREVEGVTLTSVCDVSPEALDRFGTQWDIAPGRRYPSLDALLAAERPDIAVICTWGVTHAETGIRLARSGRVRAILCEKPFTSTAAEAERFVAAARERGVLLVEAFKFRHHPAHIELKARLDAGAIGDVVTVRSTFCQSVDSESRRPENNWRWNRARGGGSIYDLACYGIHHARFVFGAEPVRVFASAQQEGEVDAAAAVQLVFPGDRTALLSVGHNVWRAHSAEVAGSAGMLRLENPWNNEDQAVTLEQHTAAGVTGTPFRPVFQFSEQLSHLAACLVGGRGRAERDEAEDVGEGDAERPCGLGRRQARLDERRDRGLGHVELARPEQRAAQADLDEPGVPLQVGSHGLGAAEHALAPGAVEGADGDLGARRVHHCIEQLLLAPEVAVERHGADAQPVGEATHAERVQAVAVEHLERDVADSLPAQLLARRDRHWSYSVRYAVRECTGRCSR